jgi:Terminase large subunit, T4likevirus-type, N-terminal
LWRTAESAVGPLKSWGVVVNRAERTIEFPGGGYLGIYSMDSPDSIRGEAFHLVIIDEAAMIAEEAWTDAIQPTLADYGGQAILISTPKGRNWFFREYSRGLAGDAGCESWRAPSADNPNPNIQNAAREARDRVPDRTYRQEWLAEFVEHTGEVFRNLDAVLSATTTAPSEHLRHTIVAGLDWAQVRDRTALSIFCLDCRRELHLDYFNQLDWAFQRERVKVAVETWSVGLLLAEANSIGSPNIEALELMGLPVSAWQTTAQSKARLVQGLALSFEKAETAWLPDPLGRAELQSFEVTFSSQTGLPRYSAPQGMTDDTIIARGLAYQAALMEAAR